MTKKAVRFKCTQLRYLLEDDSKEGALIIITGYGNEKGLLSSSDEVIPFSELMDIFKNVEYQKLYIFR